MTETDIKRWSRAQLRNVHGWSEGVERMAESELRQRLRLSEFE